MSPEELTSLKYPIGKYQKPVVISDRELTNWIEIIAAFPEKIAALVQNLNAEQKGWRYRPDSWNICQIVHHCAESHMNALIRAKWTLTEDTPTIKPYDENAWTALPDANEPDISNSLLLIESLHHKWVFLLRSLSKEQLQRHFIHPDHRGEISIAQNISNYAWHCEHHLGHITGALKAKGIY